MKRLVHLKTTLASFSLFSPRPFFWNSRAVEATAQALDQAINIAIGSSIQVALRVALVLGFGHLGREPMPSAGGRPPNRHGFLLSY